jgi:PIN domain nuclease of toxin-antitoxin system
MRYLLDTHVFLWMHWGSGALSAGARSAIVDPASEVQVSLVSLWELQIKIARERLGIAHSLEKVFAIEQQENDLQLLPLRPEHVWRLAALPAHHGDPFDRMLVAQALVEDLVLITKDSLLRSYPVRTLW